MSFFSCSKAAYREARTAVTTGSCLPIILCANTHLYISSSRAKVERDNQVTKFVILGILQQVLNLVRGNISDSLCHEMDKEQYADAARLQLIRIHDTFFTFKIHCFINADCTFHMSTLFIQFLFSQFKIQTLMSADILFYEVSAS